VISALSVNPHPTFPKNLGVRSVYCTGQGNDFELIPTVEIETRNPVEGYVGSVFLAICNHCGVMAA